MAFTKRPGFAREVNYSTPVVSTSNSSTTLITDGNNFTGEWEDVGGYDSLTVSVSTDQNGYYEVQFSPDGTNVDSTLTRYYRTDLINPPHRFTIARQFIRIRFFNDSGSDQTYFRLQTIFGDKSDLNAPTSGTLPLDFDATVVRPTIPEDEITLGRRQGVSNTLKFGFNNGVDSASPEVIASFGGTFTPLAAASTLDIVSSDAADTSAGTGARTLLITGLDANRRTQNEFVTMNGTTTVTTANTYLGVNRALVFSSGSSQTNEGTISITATTGGSDQAEIPLGNSVTQQVIFFNQDGFESMIKNITITVIKLSGGSAPRTTHVLKVWNPKITDTVYTIRTFNMDSDSSTVLIRDFVQPLKLDPTDVLWLETTTNTNNTIVSAEMDITSYRQPTTSI